MLLKSCQSPLACKRKGSSNLKQQQHITAGVMTSLSGMSTPRIQRKMARVASKRHASGKRLLPVEAFDPCDSSSDSGLGLDLVSASDVAKRKRVEVKMDSDDANDNFAFEEVMSRAKRDSHKTPDAQLLLPAPPRMLGGCPRRRPVPGLLVSHLLRGGAATQHLQMLSQPEQQHRARYQTEGSRGAVKDRTGNSFPAVKLVGYTGPAVLQVFIGSDTGRPEPHMFYQACRVSGKNSTPCREKIIDGTVVIEIDVDPDKDMVVTCDCVGILKERNVDVEHRFPDQSASRSSKKKSTRCRLVFRALIPVPGGDLRTLEVTSQPIVCTQPPGVPEICKKSLQWAPCSGGQELFILGKNFLKDTRVTFASTEATPLWEMSVQPDKEFLLQSHLVCTVPAYASTDITEAVTVSVSVSSSGKTSEPQLFQYRPLQVGHRKEVPSFGNTVQSGSKPSASEPGAGGLLGPRTTQYLLVQATQGDGKESVFVWKPPPLPFTNQKLMPPLTASAPPLPPPDKNLAAQTQQGLDHTDLSSTPLDKQTLPLIQCCSRTEADPSRYTQHLSIPIAATHVVPTILTEATKVDFKPEILPVAMATGADLSSTQSPSLDTLRRFVSPKHLSSPLPSLSVEKFLSGLDLQDKKNAIKAETDDTAAFIPVMEYVTSPELQQKCYQDAEMSASQPACGTSGMPLALDKDLQYRSQQDITTHPDISAVFQLQVNEDIPKSFVTPPSNHSVSSCQDSIFTADARLRNCSLLTNGSSVYQDPLCETQMILHCQPLSNTTVGVEESSLILAAQNARLDALVSSAMGPSSPEPRSTMLQALCNSSDNEILFVEATPDDSSCIVSTVGDSLPLSLANASSTHGDFSVGCSLMASPNGLSLHPLDPHVLSLEPVTADSASPSAASVHLDRPIGAMFDLSAPLPIGMKSMLSEELNEHLRLDALVNSALDNHTGAGLQQPSPDLPEYPLLGSALKSAVPQYTLGPGSVANNGNSDSDKTQSEKREESMVSRELTQMSDSDLIRYIDPSSFDNFSIINPSCSHTG